jgi:hypothetical protein
LATAGAGHHREVQVAEEGEVVVEHDLEETTNLLDRGRSDVGRLDTRRRRLSGGTPLDSAIRLC